MISLGHDIRIDVATTRRVVMPQVRGARDCGGHGCCLAFVCPR